MAELSLKSEFNSVEDAKACVNKYNRDNFTNFVISNNNKNSLVYHCRHAVRRKSCSRGKRPNQHYNYVGCTAIIRMYKSKKGTLKVTESTQLRHTNHVVNESTGDRFENDNVEEKEEIRDRKRLVIFDSDEKIHGLNKEASQHINERGCILFHKSLKVLSQKRSDLSLFEDGVTEMSTDNTLVLFTCTENKCTCTYFKELLVPCHHILFFREQNDLPLYGVACFDWLYRRDTAVGGVESSNDFVPGFINNEEEVDTVILSANEKYKIIMPILSDLAGIISCHSTDTFYKYVEEFRALENKVRRGRSIIPQSEHFLSTPSSASVQSILGQPTHEQPAPIIKSTTSPVRVSPIPDDQPTPVQWAKRSKLEQAEYT